MNKQPKSRLQILVEIRDAILRAERKHPDKYLDREELVNQIIMVYDVFPLTADKYCDAAGVRV